MSDAVSLFHLQVEFWEPRSAAGVIETNRFTGRCSGVLHKTLNLSPPVSWSKSRNAVENWVSVASCCRSDKLPARNVECTRGSVCPPVRSRANSIKRGAHDGIFSDTRGARNPRREKHRGIRTQLTLTDKPESEFSQYSSAGGIGNCNVNHAVDI